ncbi:hypothetical protein LXL04_023719 [Taraxacum kok-saghyz]
MRNRININQQAFDFNLILVSTVKGIEQLELEIDDTNMSNERDGINFSNERDDPNIVKELKWRKTVKEEDLRKSSKAENEGSDQIQPRLERMLPSGMDTINFFNPKADSRSHVLTILKSRSLRSSVRRTTTPLPLSLDDRTEVGFLTTYRDVYALGYCTLCGLYVYVLLVITSHYFASVALSSDMRLYGTLADMTRPGESDMRVYVTLADMTPDA